MNDIPSKNDSYNIIISIKPAYADMILNRKKRYEFRKHGFKSKGYIISLIFLDTTT